LLAHEGDRTARADARDALAASSAVTHGTHY
jgi:hypothetical protein